jgi:hypothetical protein
MKKKILYILTLITIATSFAVAQNGFGKGELSISSSCLWNKYGMTNLIGPPRQLEGQGWSNGFSLAYNKYIYRNIYITVGLGYYIQEFAIHRPFDYSSKTFQLFTTKSYNYENYVWIIGVGKDFPINNQLIVKGGISYAQFNTFRQSYYPETANPKQVNDRSYQFGRSMICSLGLNMKVHSVLIGVNLLLPVTTTWRKDVMFRENPKEYISAKSGYGFSVSLTYHF